VLVAHTGFEPVVSALRGRCPWPLDECAATKSDFRIIAARFGDYNIGGKGLSATWNELTVSCADALIVI
jgi:hypothetical protein